jgi:hypothetical protein
MKNFKKTLNNKFICEECDYICIRKDDLSKHISKHHFSKKEYYDKWLKDETDGKCKICGKETEWTNGFNKAYKNTCCSLECTTKYKHIRTQEEQFKKYGVECLFSSKEKQEKAKQTKKERYGNENYNNREKSKKTCTKKYKVECFVQSSIFRFKTIKTNLELFGVEYPLQNIKIFMEGEKTRFLIHEYKNTKIFYRASFEKHFLDTYYGKINIENGKSFNYIFNGKNKVYHSDFYIPFLNLIVEVKNSYLANRDKKQIEAKEKATIANGFNYIMIVNKDYTEFESVLKK